MSKITVTTIAGLTSGGDANTVKIESGDAFNVVSGVTTLNGGVVLNENSADVDFRVESDANTHALFLEGSTGNIGIGTSSPPSYGSTFTVLQANNTASGIVQANNSTNSVTTEIEAEGTRGAVGTRTNHDFVIKTNQTERMRIKSSEVVINEDGADQDFRIEADANENTFKIDASADSGKGTVLFGQSIASVTSDGGYFSLSASNAHLVLANTASNAISNFYLNRQGGDGRFIEFRRANSYVGSIDVSSGTVTLTGFSGQHESSGIPTNTPIGTVVSTIDELDVYSEKQQSERGGEEDNPLGGQVRTNHAKVKVSDTVGDSSVYGVVGRFNEQEKVFVASIGIGSVRVTGACAKGDLLESNGDGTAKVQSDDIIRSKTLGKVTIGNSDTKVKLVSCVLYCG